MPSSMDDLNKSLQEILQALKKGGGTGGGAGGGTKSIRDMFLQSYGQNKEGGLGIQKAIGGMAGKIGGMAGQGASIAGPIGAIAGPLAALGVELAKTPQKVREFVDGLHQANRSFAAFSPSMAAVFAQADMQDMIRKMGQGEALAPSAKGLADVRMRLEDKLAPIDTQWQRFQNRLGEAIGGGMATFLEKSGWADQLTEGMKQLTDAVLGEEPPTPPDEWLQQMDKMVADEEKRKAERAKPVRQGPARDPRPDWAWDRRNGGEF